LTPPAKEHKSRKHTSSPVNTCTRAKKYTKLTLTHVIDQRAHEANKLPLSTCTRAKEHTMHMSKGKEQKNQVA
jgi:hypothetical protein